MGEKKSWVSMTNAEWHDMFRKARTCGEVFAVVDEGYDPDEWAQKPDPEDDSQ